MCVFITAVHIRKLFAWGDSGGHVLRETTSRGMCGLVCPSRTSERGGEGHCVKEGGGEERERERERALGLYQGSVVGEALCSACPIRVILLLGVLMLGCMNNIHIRILPLFSLSLSLSLSPSPKKSDCMLKPGSLAQDITMCMCLDQTKLSTKLN
jgi:hypothetical protein